MATKKPKTSAKSAKTKTMKSKTAAKTVEKPVAEAPKTNQTEKNITNSNSATTNKVAVVKKEDSFLKGFFAKKYGADEGIMTVFKKPSFYGALLGEALGTMLLAMTVFALTFMGSYDIARFAGFAVIAIYVMIYALSGACLNPVVAVGMMATRRISVIRGVMYIVAEIIGAWLAWLVFNSFHLAGGDAVVYEMPTIAAIAEGKFWATAMIELFGSTVIAFAFARAIDYKRSVFTFAATVAGGLILAYIVSFALSYFFLSLNGNFMLNPAIAFMSKIFPTEGESFGEILGGVCQALAVYALFPMIGGVIGFYISDFAEKLVKAE